MPVNLLGRNVIGIAGQRPSVKDINAVLEELRKPPTNPAPRGKRILNEKHAMALHAEISTHTVDSTFTDTADFSNADISHAPTNQKTTSSARRRNTREALRERQDMYNKQEMALGGHHDIFNDPCPEFKPRDFAREDSIVSTDNESQVAEPAACAASDSQMSIEYMDDENVARSSQGRAGEGCSTPQSMANYTFAPLRAIDVSAVTPLDAIANEVPFVSQSKKAVRAGNQEKPVANVGQQNIASSVPSAPSNQNDSMDDVLSRMRRTPKRAPAAARRTTVTMPSSRQDLSIVEREEQQAAASVDTGVSHVNNGTYTIHQEGTFTIRKDGTYTIHPAESREVSCDQREGTFTVAAGVGVASEAGDDTACVPGEQQQKEREDLFAVPAVPTKKGKKPSKISVDQREERLNTSQKKNTSLLELMDVDVPSPGRALFAARPTKKPRALAKTPVRPKQNQNDDAMEVSIVMSDISQQPSIASDDGSMVDPVSDPRPSQATPKRAPSFARRSSTTPHSLIHLSAQGTPSGDGSLKATPYSDMSLEQKREVIKKSVERLSQPKRQNVVCTRADPRSAPHSPYVGTLSGNTTVAEPVTPFEPIDPRRMIVKNAERSGTARRVPQPRTRRGLASKQALFEQDAEATPRPLRDNLLKRMGDYKPAKTSDEKETSIAKSTAESAPCSSAEDVSMSAGVASPVNATMENGNEETVVVPPPPPPTAVDDSCVSPRAPAGRSAASTSSLGVLSPDDELLRAARSLSLEDVSPAGNVTRYTVSNEMGDVRQQQQPQRLLAESVCTVDTPHRLAPESSKRRFTSDSMEDDVMAPENSACSSEDSSIAVDDPLEVRPQSRGPKKEEVMVLKPREVVHPEVSTPNVRRSKRNRMKPAREWLGEKPVYAVSPGGSKTLVGVNEVEVRDKRWLRVRTANYAVVQQREMQLAEYQRRMREKRKEEARKRKLAKIRDLKRRHRRGEDLHTTVESIVTSSDEEDIEAIVHVR